MLKSELRKIYLNQQKLLSQIEREQKSAQVAFNLFKNFTFRDKRFVNCFITFEKNKELQTAQIFERLWREFPQITTCAPRVDFETNKLEIVRCASDAKFILNKWQIVEPEGSEIIDPAKLDVVLVPLLSFDQSGLRIGYGKGFYDKFLIECRSDCAKIGLSLFPPVEKIADAQDFDVRLDFCVTPERTWKFKKTVSRE